MKNVIKVSQRENGDFSTIQAAINSIQDHSTEEMMVTIESGVYKEKLKINKPNLYLF
ncbi:pectin methylesterase-like acyl-CoA thioesterase [Paenibacillus sp. DS2015]|uniref:pectinesterase family protein n=1 Tax=Paenibacillus sp. DS2015 TaxID=3373917 RepID=UPI003D2017D2